jgi:adenylate cyclase
MANFLPQSVKKRVPTILAILITLFFANLTKNNADLVDPSYLTSLEMLWQDAKFQFRDERLPGGEVVIVGIDEKSRGDAEWGSAASLNHGKMATVIRNIAKAKPKAIGFDILLNDPEGGKKNADGSFEYSDADKDLAAAIKEAGNVVLGVYLDLKSDPPTAEKVESTAVTPEMMKLGSEKHVFPAERCKNGPCNPNQAIEGRTLKTSLPPFVEAATTYGFVNFHPDRNGRLRHQPQIINYEGNYFQSLDLQLLHVASGADSTQLLLDSDRIAEIQLGTGQLFPVDQFGRYMLNFTSKGGTRPIIPIIDVLKGTVPAEALADKIVLIGDEAVGSSDIRPTPFDEVYHGVELHADVIDNVLHGNTLTHTGMIFVDLGVIVIFGLLLGIYLPRMNASRAIFYSALLLVLFTVVNILGFTVWGIVLKFIYPGISLVFTSATLIAYQYLTEEREKKRVTNTFGVYMDKHMIDQLMTHPDAMKLGGEKREMTVLFSDIRGFTSFSEKMTPADVVHFLNAYFNSMQGLIFRRKGTLDKLIGDAVMCFWNHPLDIKDHATQAAICALEMIHAVEDLRPVLILPGGARFDVGIGLNTGEMVVGNMGSESRMSYTVMGDNVNLGSRLESLNKYYGTKILISDTTYEECKDVIFCRELDKIQVKGKSAAVTIYEPLGVRRPTEERRSLPDRRGPLTLGKRIKRAFVSARHGERRQEDRRTVAERLVITAQQEEIATMYEHALALYRRADFDAAEKAFDHVLSLNPSDGPSRLMKTRIHKYRTEYVGTESTFDPVYKFDEK